MVVDLRVAVNAEHVDSAGVLFDPVADAVGTAPSAVATGEWSEEWLADSVRVDRKRGIANSSAAAATASEAARQSLAARQAGKCRGVDAVAIR